MHFSRHTRFALIVLSLVPVLFTAGCGQTGPLYLPDGPREQLPPQTNEAANGTEKDSDTEQRKKRPDTDDVPAGDTQAPVSPPDPDRPASPPPQPPSR